MAYDVFISYSFDDQKIVEELSAYLEQNGIRCFVPYKDIPQGKDWASAIENCKIMVYIHSETANESEMINNEIALYSKYKRPILPFKISDIKYEGAKTFHLETINWINAFPNPRKYFGKLLLNIQNLLKDNENNEEKTEFKDDTTFTDNFDALELIIDRGDAPDEKIADLLADFSILYRMHGGSGINFELIGSLTSKNAFYEY